MYSERKVQERLAQAEREMGFRPEYHSVDEVDNFDAYLKDKGKYIYDDMGRPSGTKNLNDFDIRWMLNEQTLVMCDAAYALTRYCYIKNDQNVIERFRFRVAQRLLFDIICELEDRDAAIEIMILKARQLGMSTIAELLISLRVIFSYGANATIGSADQSKTSEMSLMLFLCYDMLPCWMRPKYTSRIQSDRGKLMFGQNASGVSFQHGSQKYGIATGTTPTIYHLSEVALYADSVKLIDEGLWKAVHASPAVFGILESTGRSNKGWWADTWYYSRDNWPHSRMCPIFLPWFCGTEIYPTPTDMRTRPIPNNWRPTTDTRNHVAKSELYVRSHKLLSKHLGDNWRMPREQQWYWEWNYEEAKYKGSTSSFLQEMAGDDEEALQHSEESVFGNRTIAEIVSLRTPIHAIYGMSGQSIEDGHEPPTEDIDYSKERVPVKYVSKKGKVYRWEFIPLNFGADSMHPALYENDPESAIGKLIVFHPPQRGISYSIGVDTSEGKGEDSTVISVWSLGLRGQPDVQVAEFSSPFVSHVEAFSFILAIAAYYAQFMDEGMTRWREPYVAIEQVAAVGDTAQVQMALMGYSNFHRMSRYDSTPRRMRKQKNSTSSKRGWFTYGWSRPLLTGNFVHSAQNNWAQINSPWLIEEMKHFEVHYTASGKERMEHEEGEHDDRIFAAAMAIFCPHDMDVLADRSKKRLAEQSTLPPIDIGDYRGNTVSPSEMRQTYTLTIDDLVYDERRMERY